MGSRLSLQNTLESILGSRNVYFQPPSNMTYPAIVYSKTEISTKHADDGVYNKKNGYTVTLIDKNPDNVIVDKLLDIANCKFDRSFIYDNLNHYVFILYY